MAGNYFSEQYINEQHQLIINLIYNKRLKEALAMLSQYLHDSADWEMHQKLEQIQTSYSYMLQYMKQGVEDPARKKLYLKLLTGAIEIADQSRLDKRMATSIDYYNILKSGLKSFPAESLKNSRLSLEAYIDNLAVANILPKTPNEEANQVRKQHEETLNMLFEETWINTSWSVEDEKEATLFLSSEHMTANDISLFVSAVTLSLMECFDIKKMMWLFDAYTHPNAQINQRALVGIAFTIHLYNKRLMFYPEVTARLSLLNENETFGKEMNRAYIQWLRCQETEKIDKKMREEIIPEMLKKVNMRGFRYGIEESEEDNDDQNPDWKNPQQSDLENKLKEMSELQIEGADVYMSTFSQLKSYPFFKTLSNWFYPFDKQHSEIIKEFSENNQDDSIIDLVLESGFFCDSDKYSLCFTMMHIPKGQREMMLSQLSEQQMDEFNDKQNSESLKKIAQQPEIICNQYLHSLYRFFKVHPRKQEFPPIFDGFVSLHKYPVIRETLLKPEYLMQLGDYYFSKEHPKEAAEVYTEVISLVGGSANLFQKIGYCRQKEKRYELAIEAYLKADMIKPDNVWTNRHLATCYRLTKEYAKAIEYYRKVETVQPEKHNILFYCGSCLAELQRYEEALNYFFKLDFIETDCVKAWRAIGWCSFVEGKLQQASKYYDKAIEKSPLWQDFLNEGHVFWCMGNIEDALGTYFKAKVLCDNQTLFLELFHENAVHLIEQGVNEEDIPLMLDLI
ncbi:tetratricopeptide repeat protein [Bacteroides ihuae]|uniref:tetratricopeptide repeat protein n=1 Tax=Bacteroides ihuae TaxID=1852362 RepID=UPI0008DA0F96|nr:tetratricopeptide repeat protein [Bacteroides ihuae]